MSDSNLRELERCWREDGSVQAEAAYLLERTRVGDLRRDDLELAAYCGHAAALLAVGVLRPEADEDWFAGLARWGRRVLVLAALVIAESSLEAHSLPPQSLAALRQLLRDYVRTGSEEQAELALDAYERYYGGDERIMEPLGHALWIAGEREGGGLDLPALRKALEVASATTDRTLLLRRVQRSAATWALWRTW